MQQPGRDLELERIINQANKEQLLIMKIFGRLVGRVLAEIEIAEIEENRYKQLRRVINSIIYNNSRNPLLRYFGDRVSPEEAETKVKLIFVNMAENIAQRLSLAFTDEEQKESIKKSVQTVLEDTCIDLQGYFTKHRRGHE